MAFNMVIKYGLMFLNTIFLFSVNNELNRNKNNLRKYASLMSLNYFFNKLFRS